MSKHKEEEFVEKDRENINNLEDFLEEIEFMRDAVRRSVHLDIRSGGRERVRVIKKSKFQNGSLSLSLV